ncbi:O-antigen ligase family protein [Methylomonas rhizoryzae]|uniref:O-antigen ligase family protein n=1 Tax=Methylomonas rhizoryzae TaxID=2608981 RepID=UPI001232AB9D|nr:O-antigen ligase family protein [Methylomonas rhizoryzae]
MPQILLGLRPLASPGDALQACLAVLPLLVLTKSGWSGVILVLSAVLGLWIVVAQRNRPFDLPPGQRRWMLGFAVLFCMPVLAIALSQAIRHDWIGRYYDSPARFLLCVPILLALVKLRADVVKFFAYVVPCGLLLTGLVISLKWNLWWDTTRVSTHFVDPLTFGSLNLTLGLFCLLAIDLYQKDGWIVRLYKFCGFAVGLYLSVLSSSRTGWAAAPLVLLIWLNIRLAGYRVYAFAAAVLLSLSVFYLSATLRERTGMAIEEIMTYHWDGPNRHNSVGARLSFIRMAAFLLEQNPFGGFGDRGFATFIGHPELNRYAVVKTQEFALNAGFHNEIATNAVRSGIWGLLSSLALFVVPAVYFGKQLWADCKITQRLGLLALGYLLCTFVSGMTTEVFNLKFAASFHAMMLSCFIGALLIRSSSASVNLKS